LELNPFNVQKLLDKISHDKQYVPNFLTWFSVWGPIVMAICNPLLLDMQYRQQQLPKHERKILVAQEVGKQSINMASMLALFGVTMLSIPFLMKRFARPHQWAGKKGDDVKSDLTSLLTNISGFLALSFVSPILTPVVLKFWNKDEIKKTPPSRPVTMTGAFLPPPPPPPNVSNSPGSPSPYPQYMSPLFRMALPL
jgi:hypothetical protein